MRYTDATTLNRKGREGAITGPPKHIMKDIKCYFDSDHKCLGTIDNFYGDYYANEYLTLPEGFDPIGKHYSELLQVEAVEHSARSDKILDELNASCNQ